ncbi:bifunctional Cof-type HAD-IIB family hydrolase/peptidylprolyl isomerase [Streptococcus pseudoporcinus]|uniref:peptidylprolyl isomerase n=1 Tax=Streptococcus pseudoporcinus TaxID=361101 RepID=A0A4U9Y1J7_9STRE|nr:bifunctional Cof-type HAD-IIB family hydrolase/peptidylprolyl isomerase [Streptococcus pseudoporcinus]VTS20063.1 cyclophilin type peptidyl-prolyl cis-trans isomerase protein [Streptococcus pseudoporcinus]VUC69086.1 cyclophilin type peptidyl-prolyl cis-trans isomerase protein [Streptococcus pseudoporcinus]VUC99652.1 cyclophilin type peptidyl-prolyl cis-trans isomerase protein [Streptococcus pseudoporcinus]VUD00045.1 cyclophilin type peptidyl-prolyl cis-trans isomerase protein [Streptococcus p
MDAKTKYKAKKIKMVFFDIDDTLRIKDTGYMPETIQKIFKELKAKGILIGIASGRARYGVPQEVQDLHADYCVKLNGAYAKDDQKNIIFQAPIPDEVVMRFKEWANAVGINYGMAGRHQAVLSERNDLVSKAIDPVYADLDVCPDFNEKHDIYQMWTFEDQGDALQLPEDLAQHLRLVRWHDNSSDVVLKGTSKALGVSKVVDHLGLKPENILVFGDELNDLELFDYAGISIAMGISHPLLQEKADFVTKKVEENGILYALEELGLIEKELHFPQISLDTIQGPKAIIKTNHGDLQVQLFPEHAPKTVANFIGLAKEGYYDGIIFHRIIPDFMIQGGDPTGTGMGGQSIYGDSFEDEFSDELYNLRGALSMANAGPNTNGSQFFIVQNKKIPYAQKELERGGWPAPIAASYAENGGTPHLDRRHTVFGQLVDQASYDVLDTIAAVETGLHDKPKEDVVIETIEVLD